jgi:hypothetical protein
MAARGSILRSTSVRDFSGGWNVIDNEVNLNPKFAVKLENMVRAADGSLEVRPGYRLFARTRTPDLSQTFAPALGNFTVVTTNGSRLVTINWTTHPFTQSNHVTFTNLGALGGINFDTTFGVAVINANQIRIWSRFPATASTSTARTNITYIRDQEDMYADTLDAIYHDNHLIVVDRLGEIIRVDAFGTVSKLWDAEIAKNLSTDPWGPCGFVYFKTAKGKLFVCNGVDKPLEIDLDATNKCNYLVDPADNSNSAIPVARLMETVGGYLVMVGADELGNSIESVVQISAKNTTGVYEGNAAPDDAINIDLAIVTQTASARITGLGVIRNKLFAAFRDNSMLGTLGEYTGDGTVHTPRFDDNIPQHGTAAPRSIFCLGNDIFMADFAGVPSISISYATGQHTPERISELIEPAIQKNLSRLSADTIEFKVFAVWSPLDRRYMLFMPKYDTTVIGLEDNPATVTAELVGAPDFILYAENHRLDEGDYIVLGSFDGFGGVADTNINGTRLVKAIIDDNYIMVTAGANFSSATVVGPGSYGGGFSATYAPVNDETPCYSFSFNRKLGIKSWSRFRGLSFDWGTASIQGRLFFGRGGNIFQMGTSAIPIYADNVGNWSREWNNSTAYTVGQLILANDGSNEIYKCLVSHTSDASASFAVDRADNPTYWQRYYGDEIDFEFEMPWADFDKRTEVKQLKYISFDTRGKGLFTVEGYVDSLYRDDTTLARTPSASISFHGSEAGGYGGVGAPYGGGRRTRDEFLWYYGLKFKLLKLRFVGSTINALKLISININYLIGSHQR